MRDNGLNLGTSAYKAGAVPLSHFSLPSQKILFYNWKGNLETYSQLPLQLQTQGQRHSGFCHKQEAQRILKTCATSMPAKILMCLHSDNKLFPLPFPSSHFFLGFLLSLGFYTVYLRIGLISYFYIQQPGNVDRNKNN